MGSGISLRRFSSRRSQSVRPISSIRRNMVSSSSPSSQQSHPIITSEIPNDTSPIVEQTTLSLQLPDNTPEELKNFMSDTPFGEDKNIYRYFCPLCMNYYKSILKSCCCGNYVCYQCCKEYLLTKSIKSSNLYDIVELRCLNHITCPNCSTMGFHPTIVDRDEIVRDYSQSLIELPSNTPKFISPLKVGDTFDDLKRKMVLYNARKFSNRMIESEKKKSFEYMVGVSADFISSSELLERAGGGYDDNGCGCGGGDVGDNNGDQDISTDNIISYSHETPPSEYGLHSMNLNQSFNNMEISSSPLSGSYSSRSSGSSSPIPFNLEGSTFGESNLSMSVESSIVMDMSSSFVDSVIRDSLDSQLNRE